MKFIRYECPLCEYDLISEGEKEVCCGLCEDDNGRDVMMVNKGEPAPDHVPEGYDARIGKFHDIKRA